MPIDVEFEKLPDATTAGPPTCPPENTALWLESKLEAAQTKAAERGGRVIGFMVKKADVKIDDVRFGTVMTEKDHLFIASEIPEQGDEEYDVLQEVKHADLLGEQV